MCNFLAFFYFFLGEVPYVHSACSVLGGGVVWWLDHTLGRALCENLLLLLRMYGDCVAINAALLP